jgi:hypothetical protein
MIRIEKSNYDSIFSLYRSSEIFFPLIASVLLDKQDGVVYANDPGSPSQAYVENTFGFAQVFGETAESFEKELERYLLVDKCFNPAKIRLYAPYLPGFLALPKFDSLCSYRQRFTITAENFPYSHGASHEPENNTRLCGVDENNVSLVDKIFGIVRRFWRSPADFIQKSNAVVVLYKEEPASICYSAAEADHRVEIDVLTTPEFRNLGLAKLAVTNFVDQCFSLSLHPLWDCFTNNAGSMSLSKSVGFIASSDPYPFFTINK